MDTSLPDPSPVNASADLISFLQAIPEGRMRRGVRFPQWFLLLVAVLGILNGCQSLRDLGSAPPSGVTQEVL